ncbi:MAG: 50S ribosomal protein L6 [Gammaproteobacteria bacterium]|nr:50S ribosomal protein L6 [Gammaproteobacteria bacterium]
MSRVAKSPVALPTGVEVTLNGDVLTVKGGKGTLEHRLHATITVAVEGQEARVQLVDEKHPHAWIQAGTARALLNNMVKGVSVGFERKLNLVGVGYKAQAQGKKLNLSLGFSHPVEFAVPEGITVETPTATEILVKGVDRQQVGQVAANIRGYRPPEPYKGKGVRYSDEVVRLKEAKKK